MNEFELIDLMVSELGDAARGVVLGPGDDGAVTRVPEGCELVSSIDALLADVHFPVAAAAGLVGYRAIMVSLSDLAAMGAEPGFALVALNLPEANESWAREFARGIADAANNVDIKIVGGNVSKGPLCVTVSVHGYVPQGRALTRSDARSGDVIFVTGALGAAAAAVCEGGLADCQFAEDLSGSARSYFMPQSRVQAGMALRGIASSVIDISDGLLQDLLHICVASGVGAQLDSNDVPVAEGADLDQALNGGDDYELCFTVPVVQADHLPPLGIEATRIGSVRTESGIELDGEPVKGTGYRHFQR
ncbi:MAG: thiamine-phosphate kinase [Gammaproteobacteria bacterium]|nr:thiamine-phosphate kinase [Gammaproteobacteria bacterium]